MSQEEEGEDQSWWTRLFGSSSAFDLSASGLDAEHLTVKQYLEVQNKLLSARRKLKEKMECIRNEYDDAQTGLLETYKRFKKYVEDRDECPWAHHKRLDNLLGGLADAVTIAMPESTKEESRKAARATLESIQDARKLANAQRDKTMQALSEQQNAFSLFITDQDKVLAVIEKAAARQQTQENDIQRSRMYKTIVTALEISPAMQELSPAEAEREKAEIYQVLRQLEVVEARTDELIERVRLKLESIQIAEKEQGKQLSDQVTAQESMNSELDELTQKIDDNTKKIQAKTTQLGQNVLSNVKALVANTRAKAICLCIMLLVILLLTTAGFFLLR